MTAMHWMQRALSATPATGVAVQIPPATPFGEAWAMAAEAVGGEDAVAALVAAQFRVGHANLDTAEPRALRLVPEALARKFHVFPLREDDRRLVVATSNPADLDAEQALGFASGRTTVFEVAPPAAIQNAIDERYSPNRIVEDLLHGVDSDATIAIVQEVDYEPVAESEVEAEPVVKLANLILRDAVVQGASDVHIEPGRTGGTVRFRVDGVLRQQMQMPMPALVRVVSRIKVIARLDIADRLRPQDGRATIRVDGVAYDLRISTVPTRDAEKVVIRVLRQNTAPRVADLGLPQQELEQFRRALAFRDGIVIVTGPTGSGKTTTLYAAIRDLATGEVNVMTVEDPVEYELPGITQIQVDPKRNVTFATALRAILRQDPDIILVGEIRDLETAETAVQAAMTGHLVLATLHTNDAVSAVQRLEDIGLDRPSIAGSLRAVLAQRLVRRICSGCRGGKPCPLCGGSGYRGRAPVIEVFVSDARLEELIARDAPLVELQGAVRESGARPMAQVGRELVANGITTVAELERVLGDTRELASPAPDAARIMLVDDDSVNRTLARTLLEKTGLHVVEACDGVEALEKIAANCDYALVVLDLDMPRMGGLEVLRSLRRSVTTAGLPVVILTGSDHQETEIELMDAGADDYIRKPIDPPRFLARIKAALRRASL